jgi:hypothetical protein
LVFGIIALLYLLIIIPPVGTAGARVGTSTIVGGTRGTTHEYAEVSADSSPAFRTAIVVK